MLIATDDPTAVGHLAVALDAHVKWLRRTCMPVPPEIEQMLAISLTTARRGQPRPYLDDLADLVDRRIMQPLSVTYEQGADALQVSDRTLRRLVSSGALPTIQVGGAVRIRTADLQAYIDSLSTREIA